MNTRSLAKAILALLTVATLTALGIVGCEHAEGLDGLTISPSYVEMTKGTSVVFFSVSVATNAQPRMPIEWRVSNPALGSIVRSSGTSALYSRTTAKGDNIITARDQADNEGFATVHQK